MKNPDITHYRPAPGILFTEVDNELVLFDPIRGLDEGVYILDDIGARIWQLLEAYGHKSGITEQLLHEYEVDENTVTMALDELISQLVEHGFLTAVPSEVSS